VTEQRREHRHSQSHVVAVSSASWKDIFKYSIYIFAPVWNCTQLFAILTDPWGPHSLVMGRGILAGGFWLSVCVWFLRSWKGLARGETWTSHFCRFWRHQQGFGKGLFLLKLRRVSKGFGRFTFSIPNPLQLFLNWTKWIRYFKRNYNVCLIHMHSEREMKRGQLTFCFDVCMPSI